MNLDALDNIAALVAGIVLVALTLRSAVKTFVVPRGQHEIITSIVLEVVTWVFRPFFQRAVPGARQLARRSSALSLYAPIALLCFYATWLLLTWLGFALVFWGVSEEDFLGALRLSGSSIFTLGFTQPPSNGAMASVMIEAGIGLFLIALLIGYFPTIYSAYVRRESVMSALQERAGTPPSGLELLLRHEALGGWQAVDTLWTTYEAWFGDIGESHIALEVLPFYRSLSDERAWPNASGAVLDAAVLVLTTVDRAATPDPAMVVGAGSRALWRIGSHLGLDVGPRPSTTPVPDESDVAAARGITVTRAQWDDARARLAASGIPVRANAEASWAEFVRWRSQYDRPLVVLAAATYAPPAPWIEQIEPPRVRFFGSPRG
jgi:hypothetical protein